MKRIKRSEGGASSSRKNERVGVEPDSGGKKESSAKNGTLDVVIKILKIAILLLILYIVFSIFDVFHDPVGWIIGKLRDWL